MIIFPAIDIYNGNCVRLLKGNPEFCTNYGEPLEKAINYEKSGAEYLHIVDLNAAFDSNDKSNKKIIKKIISSIKIPVQLGGGIRSIDDIQECIDFGAKRVILGTLAYNSPDIVHSALKKYPNRIIIGMDSKDGYIAVKGWKQITEKSVFSMGKEFADMGIDTVLLTDISRDGTLCGVNANMSEEIQNKCKLNVIASGGVMDISDISILQKKNIYGVILGRSLYEGKIILTDALKYSRN